MQGGGRWLLARYLQQQPDNRSLFRGYSECSHALDDSLGYYRAFAMNCQQTVGKTWYADATVQGAILPRGILLKTTKQLAHTPCRKVFTAVNRRLPATNYDTNYHITAAVKQIKFVMFFAASRRPFPSRPLLPPFYRWNQNEAQIIKM